MNAVSICKQLQENIQQKNLIGIVHSVFDSAFNVITSDNQFIAILAFNKPMSPNAIKLSESVSLLELGIEPGMKVYFHDEYAWIESINMTIIYDMASRWNKSPNFIYSKDKKENVFKKINIIKEFLINEGKTEGILSLLTTLNEKYRGFELILADGQDIDKKEQFIKKRFLNFIESYIDESIELIADTTKNIAGFGAGLTPSTDDFISGLMISRIYLFDYMSKDVKNALKFNEQLIMKIDGKTTTVSEEMLKFSSKGEVNENIRNLMLTLISDTAFDEFTNSLKTVAKFGETSGTDIISGIYIGSKILFNQYSRR